jgi:hypothetical protein
MDLGLDIHPSAPGLVCAAAAVVAGAPLFSHGLRAHRLKRQLATLKTAEIARCPSGLVHVHGRVVLDESLIAPLSGASCAHFRLEVRTGQTATFERIEQGRPFLLTDGHESIRVHDRHAQLEFRVTEQRELRPEEEIDAALSTLLLRAPEAAWARSAGATLHLVERTLVEGAECHVIGVARVAPMTHAAASAEWVSPDEVEWLRTGTDDVSWPAEGTPVVNGAGHARGPSLVSPIATEAAHAGPARGATPAARLRLLEPESPRGGEPRVWIGGDMHDLLYISDAAPDLNHLSPSVWHTLGAYVGPAVSLAGLSYLAGALDSLRSLGRP